MTTTTTTDPIVETRRYPGRLVRIIEPFGAGGGPDLLARALAAELSELWGQPVIVENHPGAGATAAPALVAKSPADGYTLLLNTSAQAYTAALSKSPPYDALKDFVPIAALTRQPYVLVAGKHAGVTTVAELIAEARARPGELRFASTGAGTGTHFGAVKFNHEAGIEAVDVAPDAGTGIAGVLAGTVEGRTTYMFAPISAVTLPHIRDGALLALAVSTARRSSLLPDVPTLAEAGVAGFDFPIWYGMWAPAGTPAAVIDKLAKDIEQVIAGPKLGDWLARHGSDRISMTQPEFAKFVRDDSESAARLMKTTGAKQ
jgi:tripartite-type tricarboxylate transporter receptor subunit TctC